ncbi:unnamed protein product [Brugia timori]|uniref:Secreted protein n=1 Tax=Brugia timori TaxID=42155 RepID=A0A0R3QKH3_9BILA|nr:unnamed protein product [Brugia timori]
MPKSLVLPLLLMQNFVHQIHTSGQDKIKLTHQLKYLIKYHLFRIENDLTDDKEEHKIIQ